MTDNTVSPETFDLIAAIEGATYPEKTVPFLFDAEAAQALANLAEQKKIALALSKDDEFEELYNTYEAALEALKGVTFKVTVKLLPPKVLKSIIAEVNAKHPPKINPLTGREEFIEEREEFFNLLKMRAQIVRFEDPQGRVVEGPLDRELVQKLLDNAPLVSQKALGQAILDLETGSEAGYEQIVQATDFLPVPSPEATPAGSLPPSE